MTNSTRRQFLKRSLGAAGALTTAASMGLNLSLSSRVMAQSSARFNDHKALVCVFLYGGNDSYNLLVPTEVSDYQTYQSVRQNLAYPRETLLPITPNSPQPYALGMPAEATSLHSLFTQNKLSVVANIGPMAQPITKSMLQNNASLLPPQLFSHNDQQSLWQSSTMNTSSRTGWGGRMADLIADTNDTLSMNLSLFGSNLMQAGTVVQPFAISPDGPEAMVALDANQDWNSQRVQVFQPLMQQAQHPLELAYANKIRSAEQNNQRILDALETVTPSTVTFPFGNELGEQLQMVASLIATQPLLGQRRQIYFVGMGGWDTHDAQAQLHPQLLGRLGDALKAFQDDLTARGISQNVVTFTLSEFGRTLTSNGDGTDHGWGGHQLVMGDAINGGDVLGQLPSLALNSDDDIGDGRMIPTLSIEHMGHNLASWFGLSNNELDAVFPNASRFDMEMLRLFS